MCIEYVEYQEELLYSFTFWSMYDANNVKLMICLAIKTKKKKNQLMKAFQF